MKKLLLAVLVFFLFSPCYAGKTIKDLEDKGFRIIEDQSFQVTFENWGKVRFVSAADYHGRVKLLLYLADDQGNILHAFPEYYGNLWSFEEVKAVAFRDVNQDGLKDVIVIADFVSGMGSDGMIPFKVCGIYFQRNKQFIDLPKLNEEINNSMQNTNIAMVMKFTGKKVLEINQQLGDK